MKALLALSLCLAAVPLRAQVVVPPEVQEEDDAETPLGGAGVHTGKADSRPGTTANVSEGTTRGGGSGSTGGTAKNGGVKGLPPVKITTVMKYANIPSMSEHQYAHGIARLHGPGQAVSVGITNFSDDFLKALPGGDGATGMCMLSMSPRAMADTYCDLYAWISETPGGPPISEKCYWPRTVIINDATLVGGHFYAARSATGDAAKQWGYLCNLPKLGATYYCNYTSGGWDKPTPPKQCDAVLNYPMDSMPQDLWPANAQVGSGE